MTEIGEKPILSQICPELLVRGAAAVGGVRRGLRRPGERRGGLGNDGIFVTIRAAIEDPDGRTVELTEERWGHIVLRHPEIEKLEQTVLRAVRSPDRRMSGRLANEEWYYVQTDMPSNWLKAVVAYAEERGHIVTAYARRSMP